ncbi:MAG TPA: hypothetical protein VI913_04450, partial [Candidatus Peribacteraceae bacterium]|nr:hypothetical protein [Candidatus Peribacteraceae bacterium]
AVFNGNASSPDWDFVDGSGDEGLNKDSSQAAGSPQLVNFKKNLYVIWSEVNGQTVEQIRVARQDACQ